MGSYLSRWSLILLFITTLSSCATSETPAAPEKVPEGILKKIQQKNEDLTTQNRVLESDIQQLNQARDADKKAFEQRLTAMERTISLMEQNLDGSARSKTTPRAPEAAATVPRPARPTVKPSPPEVPIVSPAIRQAVRSVNLPTMDPLGDERKSRIAEPNNRAFVVAKPGPVKGNKKAPAVRAIPNQHQRGQEIPTPENSPAIASAQLNRKPDQPRRQRKVATPSLGLQAKQDEIWEDPDLEEPVSPIRLKVFPAANRKYNEAFKALTRKDYQAAIDQFDFFLSRYPNDVEADNAQFWRGVTFYDRKEWDRAEDEFRKVLRNYKHGETRRGFKTPDSVLMIAKIYLKKNKPIRARYYFEWVLKKYPTSRSANKAQRELDSLRTKRLK